MDIPKTIKYIRLKKDLKQSDIKISKSASNLSRFENGDRDLKTKDLNKIIDQLDIHPNDFFHLASNDNFKKMLRRAAQFPNDKLNIEQFKSEFFNPNQQFSNNSKELSYYYATHSFFLIKWNLANYTDSQLSHVYNHLKSRKYFGRYEYILSANMLYHMKTEQMMDLLNILFPFKETETKISYDTKRFAYTTLINTLTKEVYNRDYETAMKIIKIAEALGSDNANYYFRFSVQYFKNIIFYRKTQDIKYLNKVYTYVDLIKDIGDLKMAHELEIEVKKLMFNDSEVIDVNTVDPTFIKEQ